MTINQKGSSSVLAPGFLALLLLILVGSSVYLVMEKTWWLPEGINEQATTYDIQFGRTLLLVGLIFLFAQFALGYVILRYRDTGQKATYSHGNDKLEVTWTVATAVLFFGLGIAGEASWANLHFRGPAEGAIPVEVLAKQFTWTFRYPGADGEFGRIDPSLIDDALGNPFGLDDTDPVAYDDVVSGVLVVPAGQEIDLRLRTQDVTHSFFVRELRLKQDTTPGLIVRLHFQADKPGEYDLICAELCGLQHNNMNTKLRVVSQEEFGEFLAANAPEPEEDEGE